MFFSVGCPVNDETSTFFRRESQTLRAEHWVTTSDAEVQRHVCDVHTYAIDPNISLEKGNL